MTEPCCAFMKSHLIFNCSTGIHKDPWECDTALIQTANGDIGIPVRDGGTSYIKIEYCPWCGAPLAKDSAWRKWMRSLKIDYTEDIIKKPCWVKFFGTSGRRTQPGLNYWANAMNNGIYFIFLEQPCFDRFEPAHYSFVDSSLIADDVFNIYEGPKHVGEARLKIKVSDLHKSQIVVGMKVKSLSGVATVIDEIISDPDWYIIQMERDGVKYREAINNQCDYEVVFNEHKE